MERPPCLRILAAARLARARERATPCNLVPRQASGSTDLSELAIDKARTGKLPETISAQVSPERLRRFFVAVEEGYQINQAIRDLCVFADKT